MTTTDARKRRRDRDLGPSDNILVSRTGMKEVADAHRRLGEECRTLATLFDERAAYIDGLVDGFTPATHD